jgi:hypothetical protein
MGQSLKAIVQLLFIITLLTGLAYWIGDGPPTRTTYIMRSVTPVVTIALAWLLLWDGRYKDLIPDKLSGISRNIFERDGLCFAVTIAVEDGICWLEIYYQNRYSNTCRCHILVRPWVMRLAFSELEVDTVDVRVLCDGGAFGVCSVPWPVARKLQGRVVVVALTADTEYPAGRGKPLLYRQRRRVDGESGVLACLSATRRRLVTLSLQLPTGVADRLPPGLVWSTTPLWQPDLPTGGFPVQTMDGGAGPRADAG